MKLLPLESQALSSLRDGQAHTPEPAASDPDGWTAFAVSIVLEAGRLVRGVRSAPISQMVSFKPDGSPVSTIEKEIEALCRKRLAQFQPDARMVGEEEGGSLPTHGDAVAIDPIDGTWSLLNRTPTCAVSVCVFRDASPLLGVVLNPATGELAYGGPQRPTRLVQLSAFGEDDAGFDLPLERCGEDKILVDLHPSRSAGRVAAQLFERWSANDVNLVRMTGGSPAWALLDAAKGATTYANLWSGRPAQAFDLSAGVCLVLGAGGRVIDPGGENIDPIGHVGPLIAGIDASAMSQVREMVARVGGL